MSIDRSKKCFIITPIGDAGTDIRRHIDGIIDAVLKPVVEDQFYYELEVSHRIDAPGNIPKQVITSIYESDLVIANLTTNNPNVMYELALRHCFGSAAIIIAENGTKIPADIVGERTIFYTNDAQGVIELKERLASMIQKIIDDKDSEQQGPVYDALRYELQENTVIQNINNSEDLNPFSLILERINDLQAEVRRSNRIKRANFHEVKNEHEWVLKFWIQAVENDKQEYSLSRGKFVISECLESVGLINYSMDVSGNLIRVIINENEIEIGKLEMVILRIRGELENSGVNCVNFMKELRVL